MYAIRSYYALPQLNSLGKAVNDLKLIALWPGDQHPARVGAKIERSIKLALLGGLGRGVLYRFRERARGPGTLGRHRNNFV